MNKKRKLLTPLQLKIMNILWADKACFVKDIVLKWSHSPVPHVNTIATTIKALEVKGYVSHNTYGRSHQYYPLIAKRIYQKKLLTKVTQDVFDGSAVAIIRSLITSGIDRSGLKVP